MKAKNRLILFALIVLMVLSFADSSVWAATRTSTQSGNFNDAATWGGVAPVAGDVVNITSGHTVTLNTSISLESITIDGTLEPDLGTRTLTITDDITIGSAGDVNYTANGGFINWVITQATDGTSEIINNGTVAGQFAVNNLTIGGAPGTTTLTNTAAIDDIYVHGTMTVTGSGDFTGASTSNVVFSNSAVKTLSFTGPAVFDDLNVAASSAITTSSDFTVNDDLTIGSSGALTITGTGTLTTSATTVTNGGTFSMASGTVWNMNGATTLGSDLSGIDSDVTLGAYLLTLAGYSISGDGTFATSSGSSMSLNNADGVEGALDLSGGLTLAANTDYTFTGGATGFPASTTLSDIIIDGDVTSDDSFTVTGDFTIQGGGDSFTASAGTVTFTGSPDIENNGGADADLTFYGFAMTGAGTSSLTADGFEVDESFNLGAGTTWDATPVYPVTMTGTGTLTLNGTEAAAILTVNTSGTITMASNAAITTGVLTLSAGTLDMVTYTVDGSATPYIALSAGTVRTSHIDGVAGSFPITVNDEMSVTSAINYEFYGTNTQVTLGFQMPFEVTGTGSSGANTFIDRVTDITITGGATAALSPAIVKFGTGAATYTGQNLRLLGDLTVTGATVIDLAPHATANQIEFGSGATTHAVTLASTTDVTFNDIVINGTVTTSSNYAVEGAFVYTAGTFTNSSNIVTITPNATVANNIEASVTSPNLVFADLLIDGGTAAVPAGDAYINGNLYFTNTAGMTAVSTSLFTMAGTSKSIYKEGAGTLTFADLTISGTVTAQPAGSAISVATTPTSTSITPVVADFSILATSTMTVSGTFTAGTSQTTTFAGAGNLGGAGTGNFKTLSLGGAVATTLTTLNVETALSGGGNLNQTAGTLYATSTASGSPTTISVTTFTPNALTVASGKYATVSVAAVATNTPLYDITGTVTFGAAQAMAGGVLNLNSGASVTTTVAGGVAATFTAAGAATGTISSNVDYTIGASGAIGLGTAAVMANFTLAGTGAGNGAGFGISSIDDLTIAAGVDATTALIFTVNGNLALASATSSIQATAGTITFAGTSKTITTTVDNASGTAGLELFNIVVSGSYTQVGDYIIDLIGTGGTSLTASGTFAPGTGTIRFTGASTAISNTGTLTFNNVTFAAASDVTSATGFTVNGNLTHVATGSFDATAGTVTLAGTSKTLTVAAANTGGVGASTDGLEFFNLAVSGSYTQAGDFMIDLAGSTSALSVTGSYDANLLGSINLAADNATVTNTGTLTLNNLIIDNAGAGSINAFTASDFTIEGALDVNSATSSFEATAGTITFNGAGTTPTISGGATYVAATPVGLKLWNVSVTGTVGDGDAVGFTLFGDLTVTGSLDMATNNGNTVILDGATTKTITNSGTLVFDNLTIASTSSNILSTASDFTVEDAFIIGANGKLSATGGTITISEGTAGTITINPTSAASAQFAGLTFGVGTITHDGAGNDDFNISGDLTFGAATIYTQSTTSKITFNGSDEQLIVGADGMNVDFDDVTVSNSAGVKLSHATDNIAVDEMNFEGTLRLTSGDIDLNGENIITLNQSLNNTAKLVETEGNTVKNTGSSTSLGHIFWDENFGAALTNNIMGGLGAVMTTAVSPGTVTVKRYHTQLEPGGSVGASRWYSITSATTTGLNATLKLKYDGTELGAITSTTADMLYSDNGVTAGPWFVESSSASTEGTMMTLTSTGIDGFTGGTEYWTTADVNALSITMVPVGTKGLKSSPLTSGTADNAIMGYTLSSSSGTVDLSSLRFSLSRTLAATPEFSQLKLVVSDDNDYSTTDDNTELIDGDEGSPVTISGGGAGDQTITFDVSALSQSIVNGTPKTYFLVVDVLSGLTTATTAIQPSVTNEDVTPVSTSGVVSTYDEDGTSFTFQPGMLVAKNFNGVTAGPLAAGQTSVAVFGFSIESSSNANFGGFSLSTDQDASEYFNTSTAKVYVSTDNSFATTADNTLVGQTATFTADSVSFAFNSNQSLSTAAKYFFVVMDAKATVGESSSPITFSMKHENLTSLTAAPQFIDAENGNAATQITGFAYSFLNSTATLSTTNMTAAGNISKGVNNQPLYAFTISSDNGNAVVFDDLTATVSFSNGGAATDLANYRLWYDANGNGYPDTGEQIATGTYNANATTGNLDFGTFSSSQSITSSRKYLITANVASGATAGAKATLSIENEDYVSLASPATLNTKGSSSWSGNVQTIVTPGVATKVAIVGTYTTSITTGSTVGFAVQAQDASGYPANAASTQTITIVANNGTFTVGGTATGSIVAGTSLITVSPALTAAAGSTTASVYATATSLTQSSATSSPITIFPAEATTQASVLTVGTATATTIPVTGVTAGNGDGRIIVIRQGLPPVAPTDGVTYTSSTNVGEASGVGVGQTGAGSYVVSTSSSSFTVSGLLPNQIYYIQAFEYVGTGSLRNYNATASPNSNPLRVETADGTLGVNTDSTLAVNLITDVDFSSSITTANETEFFSFIVPSSKNNVLVKLSSLPANYNVQLFYAPGAVANMSLIRESRVTSTGNEYMILNNAQAGKYILKVFGADGDQYSSSNYTIRITTSANELMSQQE